MDLFEQVTERAKSLFSSSKGSHDWEHTLRVCNLCMHIGEKEKADMEVLKIAAILHDIGREHEDKCRGKICHAEKGSELARGILSELWVGKEKIDRIAHCIETHRFRGSKVPASKEARILFDADKLDSIGAVGIGRAFLFAGEVGAGLHNNDVDIDKTEPYTKEDTAYKEFMVKLIKVKDRMLTDEGRRLASERHEFMVGFFDRLNNEVDGNL